MSVNSANVTFTIKNNATASSSQAQPQKPTSSTTRTRICKAGENEMTKDEAEDMDEDSFSEVARNYGALVGYMLKSKNFGKKYGDLQAELRQTIRAALGEDSAESEGGDGEQGPRKRSEMTATQAKQAFEANNAKVLENVKRRFMPA